MRVSAMISPTRACSKFLGRSSLLRTSTRTVRNIRRVSGSVQVMAIGDLLRSLGGKGDGEKSGENEGILNWARNAKPGCEVAPKEAPEGKELATFAGGCFWGLELAYQRVAGVEKTMVGYTQGQMQSPNYELVCSGMTGHTEAVQAKRPPGDWINAKRAEVSAIITPKALLSLCEQTLLRLQSSGASLLDYASSMWNTELLRTQVVYDPAEVSFEQLLEVFFERTDPTTLNSQGNDVGTQYRSGVYYHNAEQKEVGEAVFDRMRDELKAGKRRWRSSEVVSELKEATDFYIAESYHQQYLSKGGRFGMRQSAEKGCTDTIRCYG